MGRMPQELEDIVTGLISNLKLLESAGAGDIYLVKAPAGPQPAKAVEAQSVDAQAVETGCEACPLKSSRLGEAQPAGSAASGIAFVALAPSAGALADGPYSGEAGLLLSRIITGEKAMGYASTDEVYLTYAVRCAPVDGVITDEALRCCATLLEKDLKSAGARVVIALGPQAAKAVLGAFDADVPRGKAHKKGALRVIATYDMESLVKDASLKKPLWDDIKLAMKELRAASKN